MNYGNYRAKCPILKESVKRLDLQSTYRYRAEPFRVYSYITGLHSVVVATSVYMQVSHSGRSNLKIPEILEIF